MSEEFKKWWEESGIEFPSIFESGSAKKGWNARQPEIDALKEDNKHLSENLDCVSREANMLEEENSHLEDQLVALRAENERLLKDAERYRFQNAHNFRFFPDSAQWEVLGFRGDILACGSAETYESAIDAAMKDFSTT